MFQEASACGRAILYELGGVRYAIFAMRSLYPNRRGLGTVFVPSTYFPSRLMRISTGILPDSAEGTI